ncbi:hypothetical protein K438DRAFT_1772611 [Mycena galopus ATCC 62051]|nr:hypothetical protein K438DRAFT_1772611 [Mycena galopus ATCC 62051]
MAPFFLEEGSLPTDADATLGTGSGYPHTISDSYYAPTILPSLRVNFASNINDGASLRRRMDQHKNLPNVLRELVISEEWIFHQTSCQEACESPKFVGSSRSASARTIVKETKLMVFEMQHNESSGKEIQREYIFYKEDERQRLLARVVEDSFRSRSRKAGRGNAPGEERHREELIVVDPRLGPAPSSAV